MANLYEILGVDPRATREQVERAYRFSLEMYGDAALATYSLLGPQELSEMRLQIEEAYRVLSDPVSRQRYDSVGAGGSANLPLPFPQAVPPPEHHAPPGVPKGPPTVLSPPLTGEKLKLFREERGVRLQDIAERSKVGVRFLEYIEGDRFALLPAPVYLRSFLTEYAKAVGLEPKQTADAYMARVPRTD
jgi:hypothetical protein